MSHQDSAVTAMVPLMVGAIPIRVLRSGSVVAIATDPLWILFPSMDSGARVNVPVRTPKISAVNRWESSWMTVPGNRMMVMMVMATLRE